MSLNAVPAGKDLPEEVNVIIEIPAHADPVKYEVDKDSGQSLLIVSWQRACTTQLTTAMFSPCQKTVIQLTY